MDSATGEPINWVYANGLGERDPANITDHDVLSALSFDKTGEYLSVGDKGGRVIVFKRIRSKKKSRVDDYEYFTEFQSHEPGFDYLKSAEIEEKINAIEWVNVGNSPLQMLSTNDKTIKLWKINYQRKTELEGSSAALSKGGVIKIPKSRVVSEDWEATPRKEFSNAHNYHVNSLSVASDGEHFLSSDDLRVNIWNMETAQTTFSIVDIKPPNIDDLNEVITHAEFHPTIQEMFLISSSKGSTHVCDIRENSSFEKCSVKLEVPIDPAKKHFFSEIVSSVSSATFNPANNNQIVCRDYLTVKVWDVRNTSKPVKNLYVTDYIDKKLCDLYEAESVFDKFKLQVSPDGSNVVTGAYNSNAHIINLEGKVNTTLDAVFGNKRGKVCSKIREYNGKKISPLSGASAPDLKKKVILSCWHPRDNIVGVANHNCIFLFNQEKKHLKKEK